MIDPFCLSKIGQYILSPDDIFNLQFDIVYVVCFYVLDLMDNISVYVFAV